MIVRFPICTLNLRKLSAYSVYADTITRKFNCKLYNKRLFSDQCVRHTCRKHLVLPLLEDLETINGRNLVYRLLPCRTFCNKRPQIKNPAASEKPDVSVTSQFDITGVTFQYEAAGSIEKAEVTEDNQVVPEAAASEASPSRKRRRKKKKKNQQTLPPPTKLPLTEKQETLLRSFPQPKTTVHNLYTQFASHMKHTTGKNTTKQFVFTLREERMKNMWKCIIEVQWPLKQSFEYTSTSKMDACNMACLEIISWLQELGKIDRAGKLTVLEKREYFDMIDKPLAEMVMHDENLNKIDDLFDHYKSMDIESIIRRNRENPPNFEVVKDVEFQSDATLRYREEDWYSARNAKLYESYLARAERDAKKTLPIMPLREKIVDEIEKNAAVVIEGETGCGKSTQVPQFILDHYIKNLRASDCNIVVAQPRRISAISIAEWVAKERGERLGESIGYHVRLNYILPPKKSGSIVYVTAGLLLRKIVSHPDLSEFSHVIIDEAHERTIDIDLLLYLLKRALAVNPKLHIVIMSATINAKLFQNYYRGSPVIFVPGFVYPVQTFFFEKEMALKLQLRSVPKTDPFQPNVDHNIVLRMIDYINENRPAGAILVFLPGWSHIKVVRDELKENSKYFVVCAHSKLSKDEQSMIFQRPPQGMRKVVLATNIAETGITIDDVTYVVDSGIHREERMDVTGHSTLGMYWISQANVKQREGRAGRTRPGECYHLFNSEVYSTMDKFPKPEIQRVPLDKTILVCKAYTKTNEKMVDFLAHLPDPPTCFTIRQAVTKLIDMKAMTENEDLTPLGKRIFLLTLDPLLSKAVVYAALFKCLSPVLTTATLLSSNLNIFPSISLNREGVREIKKLYSPGSDHIASTWIYHHWESLQSRHEEYEYCMRNNLSQRNLATVSNLRTVHRDYLVDVKLVSPNSNCLSFNDPTNTYARSDELVKAVLFSGLNNLIVIRDFQFIKGRLKITPSFVNEVGIFVQMMQESVNSKRNKFPVPFMTYFDSLRSAERRVIMIYDTSLLSPLTVLLFYGKDFILTPNYALPPGYIQISLPFTSKNRVNIIGSRELLERLKRLKSMMWAVMDYLVEHSGYSEGTEDFEKIITFRDKLLSVVVTLLDEEGAKIDYDESGKLQKQ